MKPAYLSSLGARRTKDGLGRRSAVAMWAVAVLLAVLAVTVPLNQPASAQTPPSVTVSLVEVAEPTDGNYKAACESIVAADAVVATEANYETGCIRVTLLNIDGFVDTAADPDWILSVSYKTASQTYARSMSGGPGKDWESDFPHELDAGGRLIIHLDRLVPESAYGVEALLYEEYNDVGQWMKKAEGSTTFDSKGGCYVHPDPDNDPAHDPKGPNNLQPKWFGGGFNFSTQEKAELTLDVYVTNSGLAGVNSGRCIYYKYRARGGADRGPFSAYVYTKSGGRRAWIKLTGLEMGTTYDFTVSFHPTLQDGNVGTQGTTLGPRMAVRSVNVDRITETSARATIEVDNPNSKTHTVYHRYYKTADADDSDLHVTGNANTVTDPIVFSLPSLTASTEYKMEASLQSYFPGTRSEFDVFPTKPNKPTGLTVTPGNEQLELEWTKPAGGDAIAEYIVQWKSGAQTFQNATDDAIDDREALVPHVPDTATFDTTIFGLDNGTLYTVHVIAKNESGQAASDPEEGTPDVLPDKPTIQSVVEGHTQLEVTWDEPASTGSDISGYVVQWKDNSVSGWESPLGSATLEKTVFTHTITSLANGTEYAVRVRAFNGLVLPDEDEDDYNWSDEKTGTPRPEPIVTGVTVAETSITRTTATATVAIDNQTGESQTVHLRHRVNTSGSSWTDATPKNTAGLSETFGLSSLTGHTEYLVEAWLASSSTVKRFVTFTTGPVEPDPPTITAIEHGDRELTVTWTKPDDGGSQITGYKIEWTLKGQNSWTSKTVSDPNALEGSIDQALTNGTEYTVQVIAINTVGDSQPSNQMHDTPSTTPNAPTITDVTGGNKQLVVTWSEPANGGDPLTKYKVEYKEQGAQSWRLHKEVDHNTLTETIGSLTNGTIYVVQVSAKNINGYGDPSVEEPGTPRPDPSVSGVTVAETSITRTTAIATVAIDNQTSESQTVHLRHRVNTSGSSWTDATPKDTSAATETFDLSSLTGNTEYLVEAWLAGTSSTKESVTFTTDPVEADAPRNVRITGHGDKELTVAWDAPSDTGGSQITGYKVQWKLSSQNDWNTSTEREDDDDQSPYKITENLTNGDEYAVRIIAVTSAGDGSPSNEAKDTPRTIPDAPTITNVTVGDRKLTATWTAPNEDGGRDITGYKVQWKDNSITTTWDSPTGVTEVSVSGLTREITGLTNETTYGVRVRADNGETSTAYNWDEDSGIPKPDPSVGSVSVGEIEQTTAVATVTIADPTGDAKMVHLRYRVSSSSEVWTTPTSQPTTTNSVAFPQFTGLKSDTEYRVEASFDGTFNSGVQFKLFTTKRPTVLSVIVDDSTISQAGATATVTIEEPNGKQQTVRLRYRPSTQDDWSTTATDAGEIPVNTSTDVAAVPISDLKSGTLYEVEASLESDYSQSATATFTTEGPSLTGITFSEVMQESAKATIGIQAPNGQSLPVFVRYRKVTDPVNGLWEYVDTSSTGATADAPLSNLSSGTEYEVQASLVSTFLVDTISETFTTHDPSLSALTVMSITLTGATLKVDILAPNGESQTINYRYRPVTQTDWATTATDAGSDSTTSTTGSAEFTLASLTSGTQYQIQVSLDTDLNNPTLPVLEATLTTLTPDPSISDVAIDAKQTTAKATITIANPGTSGNTVHLHFREQGTNAWSSPALTSTTTTSEAIIDMTGLAERTTYEVEVALNSGFTSSTTVTFTTLVTPTITSVSVDDITKTTATATVAIANPDGTDRTVHLQYRIKDATPADTWTKAMEDSDTGSQEFDLASLKPGTTYEVEASFDSNFVTGVEDTEFTTTYTPSISSVSVDSITKTTATATVSIANPDDTSRTIHLQYREKDATPADTWTKAMEDTDTGSQEFDLASLTPGTTYEVQASFDSSFSPHKDTTFTTVFEPSISAVGVGDIEKTTATATVVIANPDGTNKTVNLQYREYNQEPEAEWTKPTPKDTATGSETFDLTSLTPGTTYEVQASFDSNFDTYKDTTFTTKFAPTISAVRVDPDSITKTTASVIVIIANPDGTGQTVQLQYRIRDPQGNWSSTQTEDTTTGSATINLTGLTAGTTYDVEVSLASGFGSTQTATFTTKFEPSISAVSIGSVAQTTATAAISIDNADDSIQTVHLQYREKAATPPAAWMSATPETSTTSAASIDISGLTADKTYEVEAWLANDTAKKVTATFTTMEAPNGNPTPSVSSVSMGSITMTTATATVNIANPGTAANTVNLRHSVKDANSWTDHTKSETGSTVSFPLSSLIAGTTYEVEAWLGSDTVNKVTASFTTSSAPSISSISVGSITRTSASATVNIANPGTAQNTVNLRYSVDGEDSWTDHTKSETGSTVSFPLSNLTAGTTYKVEAWLGSDTDNKAAATFTTTLPAAVLSPTINSVRVGNILETTATATVSIANPDDTSRTVHLQYREKDANPPATWITDMEDSDTGSQEFDLTSLTPGTTYEVQASFDSSFSPHKDTTFTTVFEPSISGVSVGSIEKTTATATVVIANPDGTDKTVNLQYREYNRTPEAEWTSTTPKDTATGSTTFDLSSLTPGTTYEVQASFDTNFDTYKDTTFTTKFAPTISAVSVGSITKTTAVATVTIANPDGTTQTVQLQYRINDAPGNWSSTQTENTTTGSATINLTGLTAGTTYDVEVSLASGFGDTQVTTFTTKFEPSISAVSIGSVTQTTASAAISIDNADGSTQTVHLQYREKDATPPASWTSAQPVNSTTSAASIPISELTADRTYEVEAWLANDITMKVTATFTTLKAPNGTPTPSVSSVGVSNITMKTATATVNIANPGTAQNTVNLRYSVKDKNDWTDKEQTETGSTIAIDLSSLTAGTTYEVEAWLSNDDTKKVTATFTTSPAPIISSISVGSITRTSASATVNIANPGTAQNTVNLRHSVDGENDWTDHTKTETGSTVAFPLSSLTAGTTYEVEAWLGSDTGNKATTTFTTTLPAAVLSPTINSVRVGNILETTATATVNIDNADGSTQTARLQYRTTNSQGNWSSTYENTSTTGTTIINFGGMTAGTRYQVQAWLASDASDKVTASFQTQQAAPNNPPPQRSPVNPTPPPQQLSPEVASVSVTNETQTTADATVKIDNTGTAQNTVNLRYSVDGEDSWTDHTKTEAGSTVRFPLSSLTAGTAYEVEAWLGSDTGNKVTATFTTSMAPSISSISVGDITKTSATATVNIRDAGTAQNTVNLRHSVDGEDIWTDHTKTEAGSTVAFPLSSLTAGTTYEVEAWLGSDTDNKVTATFTTSMAPSISSIGVGGITKTSATATVNIANPGDAQNTVNLRYSVEGEDSWTDHTKTEAGSTVEFPLSSLTAGTAYEVEAWLGSDTDNKVTATFTTSMAPSISSIGVGGITKTSATATVNIANPGDAQNTVNLRYSVEGEDSWTDHTKSETGSAVEFPLSSLTAGTAYEVEAWLGSDTDNKVTATFTTSMAPSISSIGVGGITKISATATVNIANPGDAQNTVNLRYSVEGEDSWTDHTKSETGSAVEFPLSSLTAGTTYEVEAWLGNDTDNKVTATFTTIQADAVTPPSISSVRVLNIAQTNARVVVGLANAAAEQRVYMQYKLSSAQWPTTLPQPTTQMNGSATFILSNLTAGTGYHTRVSLNNDMSDATTRPFTTTSPPPQRSPENPTPPVIKSPEVSEVTFADISQTSANATVNIRNAGTAQKTVRLRYRIKDTTWSTPPKSENTSGSSKTFALTSLTAGTSYEVQAWLNTSRPPSGTQIYEFNTLDEVAVADPVISSLQCENIGQTYATAIVVITDAGTGMKEVFLKHSMDGTDEWTQLPFTTITYTDSTSINLTGLQDGTAYQVAVALSEDFSDMIVAQCITLTAPSVSDVSIGSKTQTSAAAAVTIANAGTAQKTVHLRYREFGETKWNTAQTKTTTGANAAFNLTGLDPRTTYEVQASLDSEFGTAKYAVFTTLSPDPSVSGVSVGSITQTSATTTVTIAYPGIARKTVRLRYRVSGETEWGAVQTKVTRGGSAAIDLTGLSPRTTYEVEASLSSDFAGSKTATFSTLSLDPSVSGVSIGSITQTSAVGAVTIANPGTAQKTVHLQYRVDGASEWSDSALTATTDGPSATIYMTGLVANTEYEVRASLASDFALAQHATFTTLRYPSISDVDVTDVTKNTATAEIDIADPDGSSQTVHLRYRTTPQGTWSSTFTTASTTGEASIDLTGLTVDTEYEVEASLATDFAVAVSDIFRTQPPDPVVAEVSVNSILQTTATASIDIASANGSTQKVSLRYRTTTPRGNWSDIQTTTSATDSARIDLSDLTPGTEYDVQASLENSFPSSRTKHDTFTTLRWPSIASFEAENVARNGATVSATIADSRGVVQTVYVRHRATGYIAWRPTQQMDSVDDIASLRLRGLSSGTEYTAEASLDESFPDGGTMSVTFTTTKRDDDDDVSSSGIEIVQAARAVNTPLLGFTPQMLRFVAIEGGDNPAPQAFSVWNRAHGAMRFNLSNHEEWLSQQPMSGVSNGPDDPVTITASVDSSELASGQYVDVINIDVTSSGKSPGQIIVILDVLPPDYIRQFVSRDEGGVVILPDGTVKLIVQPLSPPKDVDVELMKLNLQAHGQPPGEQERVVVAIESNSYEPGGDTPEDVAYAPYVELWVQLPREDAAACDENKARVYSVQSGDWSLIEHRCETDESGNVWAVTQVERLGAFALVIDDAPVPPTPTPVAAALATPTKSVFKAPAPAIVRISLPAQPPTPVPTSLPKAVPMPNGKTTVAPAMVPTPTPTAVPTGNEPSAPTMQASAGDGGSGGGGFGKIILAALGVPMLIGALIVVYLLYKEKRRRDDARL